MKVNQTQSSQSVLHYTKNMICSNAFSICKKKCVKGRKETIVDRKKERSKKNQWDSIDALKMSQQENHSH